MGFAALLSGAGILGFAAIFVRWSAGVSPVAVGFYRMLFALPTIAWLALREGRPHADERRGVFWAMLGGLCFSADLWLWHTAIHFTSAANATLLVGLAPLWVSLISVIFLGHRLEARGWVGLALALGGASLLAVGAGARLGGGRGELLGFLASFGYAGYMLSLSRARLTLSARRALLVVVATCCVFFAVMGSAQGVAFRGFPASSWLALLALGLPIQVGAWWLISWGFGHVNASLGSLGLLFQQAATVLLGALLLHEIP
ncbi:MAG: DMT family transporter, partial [Firmicutes bacterium]|nr:DMT family transporter [Bacillota bacterium]